MQTGYDNEHGRLWTYGNKLDMPGTYRQLSAEFSVIRLINHESRRVELTAPASIAPPLYVARFDLPIALLKALPVTPPSLSCALSPYVCPLARSASQDEALLPLSPVAP